MWNGTMFVDLDWPLNASSLLSASAELLVELKLINWVIVNSGSVTTCLRCDGIFDDQFITQSLARQRVKIFWKSVYICRSYGQLSTR